MLSRMSMRSSYQLTSVAKIRPKTVTLCRSICMSQPANSNILINHSTSPISRHKVVAASFVRYASTKDATNLTEQIPDAPEPVASTVAEVLPTTGEPSFESLGLGDYSPSGIMQQLLEMLHVNMGLPWWEAIGLLVITFRVAIFPLVIYVQRNAVNMTNNMPQMMVLQKKMSEAKKEGDELDVAIAAQELAAFMKEKKLNPVKQLAVTAIQAPIFISVFFGLKGMANAPVASMQDGGLWWFHDLTVSDPYYALPILACTTMYLTIKVGSDGAVMDNLGLMRHFIKVLPLIAFPFMMNFQAAILCYWVTTNMVSLIQVGILRIPAVRAFFNIPTIIKPPVKKQQKGEGFLKEVKESWTNIRQSHEVSHRTMLDQKQFMQAGKGPLIKTYKYNPSRQTSAMSTDVKK